MYRRAQEENAFTRSEALLDVLEIVFVRGLVLAERLRFCGLLRTVYFRRVLGAGVVRGLRNRALVGDGCGKPSLLCLLDLGQRVRGSFRRGGVDLEIGDVRHIPFVFFTVVNVDVIVLHVGTFA